MTIGRLPMLLPPVAESHWRSQRELRAVRRLPLPVALPLPRPRASRTPRAQQFALPSTRIGSSIERLLLPPVAVSHWRPQRELPAARRLPLPFPFPLPPPPTSRPPPPH